MKEWQEVAAKEQLIFCEIQHVRTQQGLGQYTPTPKLKFQTPPTCFWKAPGPNAMNVDLATTGDTPNMSTHICYNCQKPGHIKAYCRSPRAPRINTTQNQEVRTRKMCGYCSKPGHDTTQCYSLKRERVADTKPKHHRPQDSSSSHGSKFRHRNRTNPAHQR
jgi:hypothetical protein